MEAVARSTSPRSCYSGGISLSAPRQPRQSRLKTNARRLTQWVILFGLWLAFMGNFVFEYLVVGALSAAAAIALTDRLFEGTHEGRFASAPNDVGWYLRTTVKFFAYLPWLAWQIVVSNIHVAYLVLHPRMPIHPSLVLFDTTLVSERAQVALAQSITLTPGTITVDASRGKFLVHCLSDTTREGIAAGDIQRKIAKVFDEPWADKVELTDIFTLDQVPK